jgi:hypothetical protein
MDGGDAVPVVGLSVVERVTRHALGGIPSDKLDGLHDAVHNLMKPKASNFEYARANYQPTSCSMPEYSPSVFSRMRTVLTSS